jgi:hypothetical protein
VMNKGASIAATIRVRTVIVPLDLMIILAWSQGKLGLLSLERLEPCDGR